MFPKSKIIALTAASASLAMAGASVAGTVNNGNPYVAGDMHNHNTCTDGSVSVGYALDRVLATGTAAAGGQNFNIDWFTLGNHGGSGAKDCRFSDTGAGIPGDTTKNWNDTLGQEIQGITITSLKGTPNGTGSGRQMWRWQNIQEIEWPLIVRRSQQYNKVVIEGLEWVVPGHEHTDVAVITGQTPLNAAAPGVADNMAQFEYLFDRQDNDLIGQVDASNNPLWPGKISNAGLVGNAAHQKSVTATAWLQSRFPLTSYVVPTHTERAGPFSTAGSAGYNIEHFRDLNNAGPTVAFGIESPGHMAQGTDAGGSGSYGSGAVGGGTYGFQGVYTAKVGGLWDGMLGEGRNYFVYVSSDWHTRGAFGARDAATTSDFWPGEYTKLFVPNTSNFVSQNVVDGMRSGNSYSVNADIIGPDMVFRAHGADGVWKTMGETIVANPGETITLEMAMTVPASNHSPYSFNNPLLKPINKQQPLNKPSVDHVDLITGDITGVIAPGAPGYAVPNAAGVAGANIVYNASAKIAKQIPASSMTRIDNADGSARLTFTTSFTAGSTPFYIRSRGTNIPPATPNVTDNDGNPLLDLNNAKIPCLDAACPSHLVKVNGTPVVTYDVQAWSNTWFYANPIFVRPASYPQLLVETNAALAKTLAARASRR
ncbi:hypothetical protein [Bradyrhizobium sp. WSM3983]|uniref:hypothetical protein n=1 Tax=Bradyrhizobium sp. WSM3983 TaxID=1038867 RepID=UPI00041E5983|nr:hypothetical protein [Bradyrhizobium sp. WSM3983]